MSKQDSAAVQTVEVEERLSQAVQAIYEIYGRNLSAFFRDAQSQLKYDEAHTDMKVVQQAAMAQLSRDST